MRSYYVLSILFLTVFSFTAFGQGTGGVACDLKELQQLFKKEAVLAVLEDKLAELKHPVTKRLLKETINQIQISESISNNITVGRFGSISITPIGDLDFDVRFTPELDSFLKKAEKSTVPMTNGFSAKKSLIERIEESVVSGYSAVIGSLKEKKELTGKPARSQIELPIAPRSLPRLPR